MKIKESFASFNETVFALYEVSGIGTAGTIRILRGRLAKTVGAIAKLFSYTTARAYGVFLMAFGVLGLLLTLGEYYFVEAVVSVAPVSLMPYAVIIVLSVPLLIFDTPICILLQDFFITDYIVFDFFSIRRLARGEKSASIPPVAALFLGFIPAVAAFFLPLKWVVLTIVVFAVGWIALATPEFSLTLSLIAIPFIPLIPDGRAWMSVLCILTFLSFAMKVIIGKRAYSFDIYDVLVLLTAIVLIVKGVFFSVDGSLEFLSASVLLLYFPSANLLVNRRVADGVINSVVIPSLPIAILAIIEFIVESPRTSYPVPNYSTEGISVFFASADAFAVYMLVSAVMTLGFFFEKKRVVKRLLYLLLFLIQLFVLGIIMRPSVWVSIVLLAVAYLVIKSRKIPTDSLLLIIAAPLLLFLLPDGFVDKLHAFCGIDEPFSQRIQSYADGARAFVDNIWLGSFYGVTGIHNSFLYTAANFGVFIILLLLLFVLLRLRNLSYFRRYIRSSTVEVITNLNSLAIVAMLVYSMEFPIFSEMPIYALFVVFFGFNASLLKTSRREYTDRLGYYDDQRSSEVSVIDVGIEEE